MTWEYLLIGIVLGWVMGWYARIVKDLLTVQIRIVRAMMNRERLTQQPKPDDDSGVIRGNSAYQRGKLVDLPPYNEETGIVRSPSPQDVKRMRQREHEDHLMQL